VVALNGRAVRRSDDLLSALERLRPGDTVVLTYVRDRARYEARVTLAAPR
jgi:S1-C subfamily serine protease